MAEWKTQLSYNYNPPYHHHHAYAYGIMYQAGGSEQNHANLPTWADHGAAKLGGYNAGVTQAYYAAAAAAAAARPREEDSPPRSPEDKQHGHYQGSGVVYLGGDTPHGRLCLPDTQHPTHYETLANNNNNNNNNDDGDGDGGRARSGTPTSDWEAHTSPDSWSSASSREEGLPQADPAGWVKKEFDDAETGSPDTGEDVSSVLEEPQTFTVMGNEDTNAPCPPAPTSKPTPPPKAQRTAAGRGKLRTTFSECQMNALVQRFSAQRYLSPAEMKNLAAQSGLSYQQVKTWFQNRRMKLRRHQKDAANPNPAAYANMAPRLQQYQGDARTHLQEQYSQHVMEAGGIYKNTTPQNLAYYLAAVGAAGTAGYHGSWSAGGTHAAPHPSRPQAPGSWPLGPATVPPPHHHHHQHQQQQHHPYDYSNPAAYDGACPPAGGADSSANSDGRCDSPLYLSLVQNTDQ